MLLVNKNGIEFILFFGGFFVVVDWVVDMFVDGNNVGFLIGIMLIVIDVLSYVVV